MQHVHSFHQGNRQTVPWRFNEYATAAAISNFPCPYLTEDVRECRDPARPFKKDFSWWRSWANLAAPFRTSSALTTLVNVLKYS